MYTSDRLTKIEELIQKESFFDYVYGYPSKRSYYRFDETIDIAESWVT